ncbi:MAG TPA: cytochrome D1 domain-containing protein [Steroidobacteraceae bacterium]|nr:cytochrome D1 domain-containing protein [Steroidobacteraceae bacterium]
MPYTRPPVPWCCCLALAWFAMPAPAAERLYVSNEDDGTVTVIDTDRGAALATIPAGKRPRGLALSPDGARLYVAVSGMPKCPPPIPDEECARLPRDRQADGIAVIDTAALARSGLIGGVSDPERVALSRDGRRLFVSEEDAARLAVLDARSARVLATVPVGREPEGVRVSPDGRWVLVTSEAENLVTVIDAKSYRVAGRASVGRRPRDIAITPDSRIAYVSGEADASVYRIALPSGAPALRFLELHTGARPMGVALDAVRGRLYVSTGRAGTIAAIALKDASLIAEAACGGRPWGIALGSGGTRLYSADGPAGEVAVVDTATLTVMRKITTGKGPWAVVVGP